MLIVNKLSILDSEFGGEDSGGHDPYGYSPQAPRGVWSCAPPENFSILSLRKVVLRHSETVLGPSIAVCDGQILGQ